MHYDKIGNLNGSWECFLPRSTLEIRTPSCTVCDESVPNHAVLVLPQGKPQPCQGPCVTGAWVGTGPAEINRSHCRRRSHCKTRAVDVRFIGLLPSTSFLYPFSASL